jgi:hypothetical protein
MTGRVDVERILDAFLAPELDQLPDRVIEASLSEIARSPQRRPFRAPWRFPQMTLSMRTMSTVLVGVVALAAILINLAGRGGVGGEPTTSPSPTPTNGPTSLALPMVLDQALTPGLWATTGFAAPFTVTPTNNVWTVLQDEPGSVFLESGLATVQVIDVTDAITGCAPSGSMPPLVAWAPGNPIKAPAVLARDVTPPLPTDAVGAFTGWFRDVVAQKYAKSLTVGPDTPTTIGSRPAISMDVTDSGSADDGCPELSPGAGPYVPIVAFAQDNWFNVGLGAYRFTVVEAAPRQTILIVTTPAGRPASLKLAQSELGAADLRADGLLRTLVFTSEP